MAALSSQHACELTRTSEPDTDENQGTHRTNGAEEGAQSDL